jgi:hypothetical protein
LLAKEMNALQAAVTAHLGIDASAVFWDDMVNPDHNGGDPNYQWENGGGLPGRTDLALLDKLVDSKVIWASWAYGVTPDFDLKKIKDAPQLFQSHGYDWVGCAEIPTANVLAWGRALQAAKRAGINALGLLDVQWSTVAENSTVKEWANVPGVGACTWNLEAFLTNQTVAIARQQLKSDDMGASRSPPTLCGTAGVARIVFIY